MVDAGKGDVVRMHHIVSRPHQRQIEQQCDRETVIAIVTNEGTVAPAVYDNAVL